MEKTITRFLIISFLMSLCFQNKTQAQTLEKFEPIVLGNKLQDPYTLDNMKTAYEILKSDPNNEDLPNIDIDTTHVYLRFLPNSIEEQTQLLQEDELDLFDHPFDYEILKEGDYYRDPSISQGKPTYLYTTVSSNYVIPQRISHIHHEILDYLFLPDALIENTDNGGRTDASFELLAEKLDDKALEITGNLKHDENHNVAARRAKYNPSGQILVSNPLGTIVRNGRNYDGVANVTVRIRRWHKIKRTRTNNDGTFSIAKRFRRDVNFGIIYKNSNANLVAGPLDPNFFLYGGAFLNGPKGKHWEYWSERGSSSYKWGTIMNAVHDYHNIYAPQFSIGSPPDDLRIAAFQFNNQAFAPMFRKQIDTGVREIQAFIDDYFSLINVLNPGTTVLCDIYVDGKNSSYRDLYNETIHELSHAAHWNYNKNWSTVLLKKDNRMVTEAWADGVENEVSLLKFNQSSINRCENLQERIDAKYPRVIVRDLMNLTDACTTDNIIDNVSGFNMRQIFFALENPVFKSGLEEWRDNLIDTNPAQKEVLKEYFAQWMEESYTPCNNPPVILNSDYTPEITRSISHSNQIIIRPNFKFTALDPNYRFSARIDCPLPGRSSRLTNKTKNEFNNHHENSNDLIYEFIPNTSITYSLFEDYETHSNLDRAIPQPSNINLVSIYPNPNKGLFTVSLDFPVLTDKINMSIYDISGRLLKQKNYNHVQNIKDEFNLSNMDSGVYLVKVTFNGNVLVKRMVIN